ncbi:transcription termination factor NusA [Elusimicrobiota bacterium]
MSSGKTEFVLLLETIERDKGIPRQEILRLIESAVASAIFKHIGREVPVKTEMDANTGQARAFIIKKVVEGVTDPYTDIALSEAQKISPESKLSDEVPVAMDTADFSRIAAQTAKQVILQKLREVEKESLFKDFKKKENLIVTGSVYRFGPDKSVYVSLGKIEAVLRKEEQIPGERFSIGEVIKALVRAVESVQKGPQVYLSRAVPEFVKGLLNLEVPEVHDSTIEIVKVVREAGFRTKVLVKTANPKVDPVGACVGIKGTRIRPVISELRGEKIDLISHSEKVEDLIRASLAPAQIDRVEIEDTSKNTAIVFAAEDQVAQAIGREGVNMRLATELTGWNLTVESIKAVAPAKVPEQETKE